MWEPRVPASDGSSLYEVYLAHVNMVVYVLGIVASKLENEIQWQRVFTGGGEGKGSL